MDEIKNLKEKQINDFVYEIELNDVSVSEIKMGLKRILKEEPGVKFNYVQPISVNERTGEKERKPQELESIEIYYTYIGEGDQPTFGSCKYII
jgi:hypothetical protein